MAAKTLYADSPAPVKRLARTYDLTLSIILSLCKKYGYCFAHNDTLAQMRHKDDTTITRHVSLLVREGYLCWERVGNERWLFPGKRRPNAYPIQTPRVPSSTTIETSTKRQQTPEPRVPVEPVATLTAPVVVPLATPVTQELEREGVSAVTAQKLATGTPPERLVAYLRAYREARREGKARGVSWLVAAIREGWTLPERKEARREVYQPVVPPPPGAAPPMEFLRGRLSAGGTAPSGI